jgi:hypothetical protein
MESRSKYSAIDITYLFCVKVNATYVETLVKAEEEKPFLAPKKTETIVMCRKIIK